MQSVREKETAKQQQLKLMWKYYSVNVMVYDKKLTAPTAMAMRNKYMEIIWNEKRSLLFQPSFIWVLFLRLLLSAGCFLSIQVFLFHFSLKKKNIPNARDDCHGVFALLDSICLRSHFTLPSVKLFSFSFSLSILFHFSIPFPLFYIININFELWAVQENSKCLILGCDLTHTHTFIQ